MTCGEEWLFRGEEGSQELEARVKLCGAESVVFIDSVESGARVRERFNRQTTAGRASRTYSLSIRHIMQCNHPMFDFIPKPNNTSHTSSFQRLPIRLNSALWPTCYVFCYAIEWCRLHDGRVYDV